MKSTLSIYLITVLLVFLTELTNAQSDIWTRIQQTPQEQRLSCVRQIPGTERIVAAGNGSTIMYSNDEGSTWDVTLNPAGLPNSTSLLSINFIDEMNGYAAANYGRIIRTTDGGENWDLIYDNVNDTLQTDRIDIYLLDAETVIVVGFNRLILKTKDGGDNWNTFVSPKGFFPNSIDFVNRDTAYIVGNTDSALILRTTNGGDDWITQPLSNHADGNYFDIGFVSDSVGFINFNNVDYSEFDSTYILKTTDFGNSWQTVFKISSFFSIDELSIQDDMNIISYSYDLLRSHIITHDQGLTWSEISGPFSGSWAGGNSVLYSQGYTIVCRDIRIHL